MRSSLRRLSERLFSNSHSTRAASRSIAAQAGGGVRRASNVSAQARLFVLDTQIQDSTFALARTRRRLITARSSRSLRSQAAPEMARAMSNVLSRSPTQRPYGR